MLRGHESRVYGVAVSGDGRRIVSTSGDETVRVWDARTGREIHCLRGHGGVTRVAVSGDGRLVLGGSEDATISVWYAATGQEIRRLRGHERRVSAAVLSGAGPPAPERYENV